MTVQLGRSELQISRVVLGCMFAERLSEPEITRIIHAACDAGVTSFDTAPLYAFHESERILGRALRDRRQHVQILTKAGLRWDGEHGQVLFEFHDAQGVRRAVRKDSRPAQLRAELEGSLTRLGTDVIDLLQIHHPDVDTPLADSLGVLQELRREGKLRAIGVSNFSPAQLDGAFAALAPHALDALQCEYNLLQRWPEGELLPRCRAQGASVLAYSPLARGLLAGRPPLARGFLRSGAELGYLHAVARRVVDPAVRERLVPLAEGRDAQPGQVALAWLLAQPGLSAVVVGASSVAQARENARAAELALSPEDVRQLGVAFTAVGRQLHLLRRASSVPGVTRAAGLLAKVARRLP
jgi:aryl-alcohol dehydrogenase-like predicted oxidoreductase